MKDSNFKFCCVDLLHCKCHKINLNRVEPYKDSPNWIKRKTATVNTKSNYEKCFQYAVRVATNHENWKIKKISNIKTFINKYKCKGKHFPMESKD